MLRSRFAWMMAGLAISTLPAGAAPGYAITAAQVAGVIRNSGISVSDGQVHLLSEVVARTSDPSLQVDSMTPMGSERMMVRLRCVQPKACLPFDVTIHTGQIRMDPIRSARLPPAQLQTAQLRDSQLRDSQLRDSQLRPAQAEAQAGLSAPPAAAGQPAPSGGAGKNLVVRSGSPAILLLEGEKVHIRLIVVCLQSGSAGQKIQVASKANRKIFTAEVGSDGVLRGNL